MEELNNILNTIISRGEITYMQINYLISKSESLGIDVTKELANYDIKLNGKDAEKELKWLKKEIICVYVDGEKRTQFLRRQIKMSYLKGYTNSVRVCTTHIII